MAEFLSDQRVDKVTTTVDLAGKGSGCAMNAIQTGFSDTSLGILGELVSQIAQEM